MKKTYTKTTISEKPLLEIEHDSEPISPREDSNFGYFITVDRDYHSPDKHPELESIVKRTGDQASDQADHMRLITEWIEERQEGLGTGSVIKIYPVVKYEHSGVSYSLGSTSGFDYSNNGFYIVVAKTFAELVADNGMQDPELEDAIKAEIELYNKYVNGEIYRFTLYDDKGEAVDSCSGFYDIEDIRENLPKEWKKEDLTEYVID